MQNKNLFRGPPFFLKNPSFDKAASKKTIWVAQNDPKSTPNVKKIVTARARARARLLHMLKEKKWNFKV